MLDNSTLLLAFFAGAVPFVVFLAINLLRGVSARRRAVSAGHGRPVSVPTWLRGVARNYPHGFRMGRLDVPTARWRPALGWGTPLSLAGLRVSSIRPAGQRDGLPAMVAHSGVVILLCRTRRGSLVQLAVHAYDVALVERCLAEAPAARAGSTARRTAWRAIQRRVLRRVPPLAMCWIVAGAAALVWGPWANGFHDLLLIGGVLWFAVMCWLVAAILIANQARQRWNIAQDAAAPAGGPGR